MKQFKKNENTFLTRFNDLNDDCKNKIKDFIPEEMAFLQKISYLDKRKHYFTNIFLNSLQKQQLINILRQSLNSYKKRFLERYLQDEDGNLLDNDKLMNYYFQINKRTAKCDIITFLHKKLLIDKLSIIKDLRLDTIVQKNEKLLGGVTDVNKLGYSYVYHMYRRSQFYHDIDYAYELMIVIVNYVKNTKNIDLKPC